MRGVTSPSVEVVVEESEAPHELATTDQKTATRGKQLLSFGTNMTDAVGNVEIDRGSWDPEDAVTGNNTERLEPYINGSQGQPDLENSGFIAAHALPTMGVECENWGPWLEKTDTTDAVGSTEIDWGLWDLEGTVNSIGGLEPCIDGSWSQIHHGNSGFVGADASPTMGVECEDWRSWPQGLNSRDNNTFEFGMGYTDTEEFYQNLG